VKYVVVVGFNHKKGAQIEYTYPETDKDSLLENFPHLHTLALPDGAHNFNQTTTYLSFPNGYYGISHFRQIKSEELVQKTADITRNTVQKAVCVICQHCPNLGYIYGPLSTKISAISEAYFDEKDFSQTSVLKDLFNQIECNANVLDAKSVHFSISQRNIVKLLKHEVLRLLKLVLLEKRVLVYSASSEKASQLIVALLGLIPEMLESGILKYNDDEEARVEIIQPGSNTEDNEPLPFEFENASGIRETREGKFNKPDPKRKFELIEMNDIEFTGSGHPLAVFSHGNFYSPYVCLGNLQKLELTEKKYTGFLVGTSNALITHKWESYADCLLDLDKPSLRIKSDLLSHKIALTNADLRFIDKIVSTVADTENAEILKFEGGDAWIRSQFKNYLDSFLAVSQYTENLNLVKDYGEAFLTSWMDNTASAAVWMNLKKENKLDLNGIKSCHPCHINTIQAADVSSAADALNFTQETLSREINDAGLKLKYALKTTAGGRKLTKTTNEVSQAVSVKASEVGEIAGEVLGTAAESAKETFSHLANRDYKEDAKIASEKAAQVAAKTAENMKNIGNQIWKSGFSMFSKNKEEQ